MRSIAFLLLMAGCQKIGAVSGVAQEGEACTDEPCASGLVCTHEAICAEPGDLGTAQAGEDCSDSEECAFGLVCAADNICAEPGAPGTGEDGASCASDDDCQSGFYCGEDETCHDIGIPYWEGGPCEEDPEEFIARFNVPKLPASGEIDFFAMPFPNDYRRDVDGVLDMSGFPLPPNAPGAAALLKAFVDDASGFSRNPTVYFRFSQPLDTDSLSILTEGATIHWASIDPNADDYGERTSGRYFYRSTRGKYICPNWLAVSVYPGEPLPSDSLEAVWVTGGIKNTGGTKVKRDEEFNEVMGAEVPSGLAWAQAWDDYAPFREYLTTQGIDPATVVSAAVFTTGTPENRTRYFDDHVDTVAAGAWKDCASGGGCAGSCTDNPAFSELQSELIMPRYGDASGYLGWDEYDRPVVQGDHTVCSVVTVPVGEAPASGWPVVVVLPEVGGDVRQGVSSGLAAALATRGVATVSLAPGAVESGVVQDAGLWGAQLLQRVADGQGAVGWVRATGDLPLNASSVWVLGAGEGAWAAGGVGTWGMEIEGVILGNGPGYMAAYLSDSVTGPGYSYLLQSAFADSNLTVWHPMMGMLQAVLEPVDMVSNGRFLVRDPVAESLHVLAIDGVGDADREAIAAGLLSLDVPIIGSVLDDIGLSNVSGPVSENVSTNDGKKTAGVVQVEGGREAVFQLGAQVGNFVATGAEGSPVIE